MVYTRGRNVYDKAAGDKREVKLGIAHHTTGGLLARHIIKNKRGEYVSAKKSAQKAVLRRRLNAAGYDFFPKGAQGRPTLLGAKPKRTARTRY